MSTTAKNTTPMPKILFTHCSVPTQTNVEENEITRSRSLPGETIIKGRRIIDFQYFFRTLKNMNNHGKSDCNLSNMIITEEKKCGICTSYNLKCLACNFEKEIFSENPYSKRNLNSDFVTGMVSIKGSFQDACILLAKMRLPSLNKDEFIQECKYVCFPVGKISHRIFKKTQQNTSKNLQKHVQRKSQLTAVKQSSYAHEHIQREHQLTAVKQSSYAHEHIQREHQLTAVKQSSYAHEHIQREHQLTAVKQSSYAHEHIQREHQLTSTQQCSSVLDNTNIQRKFQLTTLKQNSPVHENLQKNFQLSTMQQNSSAHENIQREHQLIAMQQCSSVSDNTNIQRKFQLTTLKQNSSAHESIQKNFQLSTMKQNSSAHENIQREHQLTSMKQCSSMSDNGNLFEQMHLGGLLVQDEFQIEEENVTEDENEFETIVPDQTTKTSDNKLIADQEQVMLNTITVKQEIDSDDENSNKSVTKETTNKKSVMVFVNAEQIGAMLTQANEGRACENTMIVNQEQVHLQKNLMVEKKKDNNMIVKSEFYDMEITNKESVTNFDNKFELESPLKKARTVTYKKSDISRDTHGIPTTAPSKEINIFQSRFESNGLVTATSLTTNLRNETATSITTNMENVTPPSTITNATATITTRDGGKVFVLMPLQDVKKINENGALIIPQMPHDIKSGTYQGVSGSAYIPGISPAMQKPASIPNVIPNASGAICVPLESTAVQQPTDSSNAMPKVCDGSRIWDALGTSFHLHPLNVQKIKEEKEETN